MQWMPRLRVLVARRPASYWTAVVIAAALIALSLHSSEAAANRKRDSWGAVVQALVADRRIAPGESIEDAATVHRLPRALLPATALATAPRGSTARQVISAGEVIVGADLAADANPLAMLPAGWLAIPIEMANPVGFTVGDSAAVLANGGVLTATALVIQRLDDQLLVGVPADIAGAVADAANQHLVTVALSAAAPPR
jgi:hypothetical protein